jgi:UDP-glucose 4-epimerase
MQKVFITGVAGFLGSHLADQFLKEGIKVAGCDSFIGGYRDNIPEQVEFYGYDCSDLAEMKRAIEGCDVVYHCAALAHEGLSVFSPHIITRSIVDATVSTITASIHNNVKRFVYCSSMARYGTQDTVPFTEDMTPKPQDPYGIGKYASELFLKNLAGVHGMEYVIVVPHNIIGPRQKYDDPYRNVVSIMINMMLQGKQPIIYGDGEQKRCFSHVGDDVEALRKMADADNVVGEIINIGPDDEFITINNLAKTIAEVIGFDLNPTYLKDRPQEVRLANCSADKIRKLLDHKKKKNLREVVEDMVDYIKKRGPKPFTYHVDLEIVNEKTPESWKNKMF